LPLKSKGTVSQIARFNDVEATKFQLLTGLIFANLAEQTGDSNISLQHKFNAKVAFGTAIQRSSELAPSRTDSAEIESGLREL
jgi:hypothetical protein